MASRATPRMAVRILNDHGRSTSRHILWGHLHTVPPVGWYLVRGHAVATRMAIPARVHDLSLGLNVHRHGLWVPVLNGLSVRSVRVAVSTRRNGECSGSWVLHATKRQDQRIKASAFRVQSPRS